MGCCINKRRTFPLSNLLDPDDLSYKVLYTNGAIRVKWTRGKFLGKGEYGKVFEAMDCQTNEKCAVKFLELGGNPMNRLDKIRNELAIIKDLDHPNIIKYKEIVYNTKNAYVEFIMELCSYNVIEKTYKGEYSDEICIRKFGEDILKGLEYLHGKKVVHRDLKGSNVLVGLDGDAKIIDFGCCRQFEESGEEKSRSLRGSPFWMSPEMSKGEYHSYPTDIWSFGCLLIEMATGKPPWSNITKTTDQVFNLLSKEHSKPDLPQCSNQLLSVINSCLAYRPKDRPTAKDLLNHIFFS